MSVRVSAGAQPALAGWQRLTTNGHSASNWSPRPLATVVRGGTGGNYAQLYHDIHAAYQNALRWHVSGDAVHGEAAVRILNAWSSTLTSVTGNADRFLASGIYGYQMANAAELVRDVPGFDVVGMRNVLLNVFYPLSNDFLLNHNNAVITNYWANWDLCNMAAVLAIGIFTDRGDLIDQAIDYFYNGAGNGSIEHAIPFVYPSEGLAQWQESGRDQGHTVMGIGLMGAFCEMAWNQGLDCYGYDDNRFLKAAEYVAKYNLGNNVPFTPYTWQSGPNTTAPHVGWNTHTEPGAGSRGQLRPVWDLVLGHYRERRGLAAPWSEQFAALSRPEGGGGDYGPNSGGFDQLGFGTLMHASPTSAVRIESTNYPGRFVDLGATQSMLAASGAGPSGAFRPRPGLAGTAEGRVSFESVQYPGTYLRHWSYRVHSEANDGTSTFAADATFIPVAGVSDSRAVSFRSHNFPDRHLRHSGFLMRIDPLTTAVDRADGTFRWLVA